MTPFLLVAAAVVEMSRSGIEFRIDADRTQIDPARSVFLKVELKTPPDKSASLPDLRDRAEGFLLVEDFADEPMALLDQASSLRATVDRIFLHYGSKRQPNAMFVVHECNAALQYVSLGFCVSILPKVPAMDNEKVVVLPIADPDNEFSRTVYFSWMKNRPLSPAVKRVRNYIAEHYRLSD